AFFCNSGTEAWEGALKLARAFARVSNSNGHKAKWRILALENSFHGRTFGSLATTGQAKYRHPFAPLLPGVSFVGFNDVDGLKRDIVTVAKPLAAGLPLGAILTTNRVASGMHPGLHGTTFGGGPLASAVAIEFLNQVSGLLKHVNETGSYFRGQLESLAAKHSSIREIRGLGLMLGVDMTEPDIAKAAVQYLLDRGILINRTHDTVLRFLPPYIITKRHVDQVVSALNSALSANPPVAKSASTR